jgi:transcriptional regulator with XRE-family HTH domain
VQYQPFYPNLSRKQEVIAMGRYVNKIPELLIQKMMRDKRRYSQHDMAIGTDLTDSTVSRIMNYKTIDNVPFASLIQIAVWLEVSPFELYELRDVDEDEEE